ncbi:Arc family DNA-binding protein [Delftia sp. BR1]|nr:Arc family DNA-binding protein [Delftia sp. BR1]
MRMKAPSERKIDQRGAGRESHKSMIRFPLGIYEALWNSAQNEGRSLNAEIVHRLAQTLGEDFAAEQPAAQPVLAEMLAQMREQTGLLRELVELARAANPD